MEQNLSELSRTFHAFKSKKGRKAIFRDVYFTRKSYSYIPDEGRRISFELYSESKHLNGDNSEAIGKKKKKQINRISQWLFKLT